MECNRQSNFFKSLLSNRRVNLQVVESFLSIQGEGKFAGKLAVFIRFAGCNLNCIGFGVKRQKNGKILQGCDTLRAVFTKEFESQTYDSQSLFERVLELKKDFRTIIVITGGEPLIHHQDEEFINFIELLLNANLEVHFESNGSIELDFNKYPLYKKCIFALGIKLSNSGIAKEKRINFKAIESIVKNTQSFYKFVLDSKSIQRSASEIDEIVSQIPNEVYCMPLGENEDKLRANALKIVEFCIKNGYNYTDRIHIRLWGEQEGV